jgi:phage minor structural protein
MLRILDLDKTPVLFLSRYKDLKIDATLDFSDKKLQFTARYEDIVGYVMNEGYIVTESDRFVIKEISSSSNDGEKDVVAQLDLETLEGKAWTSFDSTEQTISECLSLAFAGTGWTVGSSEITKKRTVRMTNCSSLEILQQALKTYRCEVTIDSLNQVIDVYEEIGEDKGVYFTSELNLKKLTDQSTTYDFYTEIEAYGAKDDDGNVLTCTVTNYDYSTKKKRYIWKDERYSVQESLEEDATAKLKDMATPYISYSAEVMDLACASEKYSVLAYDIGDTVTIINPQTGVKEKQRITEITKYPNAPNDNTCTLANKTLTFDELTSKYDTVSDTVDNITTDNGTVDGDTVDSISSSQVSDLDEVIASTITVTDLVAENASVSGKFKAVDAEIGTLVANSLTADSAVIKQLTADNADIDTLNASQVIAEALIASVGRINSLESTAASITHLLAGNASVENLETIVLNSDNAVIDVALIKDIVSNNITVNDLLAGRIDTTRFSIGSEDGTILIEDGTQTFKDQNGNIRIQIGLDSTGDFKFVLYDKTGTGVLIDSTGIKESAISDGLIKNSKIADDAAISATKLDIDSLFTVINSNGDYTITSNRIWLDESSQTLEQAYTKMSSSIASAIAEAKEASETADGALKTLAGISTLDAIGITLSNDAHVVHTNTDGTGGDWSDCITTVDVFSGETNVSESSYFEISISDGLTGTWDGKTRTYHVTGMAADNGWVDFEAVYGSSSYPLVTRSQEEILTKSGESLEVYSGGARLSKRFSVSKAPDGKIGLSYNLRASVAAIRVTEKTGELSPKTVTFSATYNDDSVLKPLLGLLTIEESKDGLNWESKYESVSEESNVNYLPSSWLTHKEKFIRATIKDSEGNSLDTQTVLLIVDAEGLEGRIDDLDEAYEGIQTTYVTNATYSSGVEGLSGRISEIQNDYYGLTNGTLLWQPVYTSTDSLVTVTARLYKEGKDVAGEYPAYWFSWKLRTESGEEDLGTGYSVSFSRTNVGFGGVVIGRFTEYDEAQTITSPSGESLLTRSGEPLNLRIIK